MLHKSTEFYQAVVGLRVVRNYERRPLDGDDLTKILEAARWTGSSKNRQNWVFVVVDGEVKDRLCEAGSFTVPLQNAPTGVALVRTPEGNDFDIGRAAQNIMLGAAAVGVASCPVTLHDQTKAHDVLGIPEDHSLRWAVALGYPDRVAEQAQRDARRGAMPAGRAPLAELVRRNSFRS